MSNKTDNSNLVGLRLDPKVLAKIDERREIHGGTRQQVIIQVLNEALF